MTRLDEQLRRELDRIAEPADPARVTEAVLRRVGRAEAMRRVKVGALAVAVAMASVAGFLGLTRVFGGRESRQAAATLAANGPITFVEHDGRTSSISTIEPDGSGRVKLLASDGLVTDLDWSSDGRRLVYGWGDLFVLDLQTEETTRLTPNGFGVSWSPDGSRVVFAEDREGQNDAIVVTNAGGTGATVLTEASNLGWTDWSPDGSRILFVGPGPAGAGQGWDIYVMNADGSGVTNLTNSDTVDLDPSWSPDGSTILFRSRRDPPPGWTVGHAPDELYLMAPDGSAVRRLTTDDARDQSPVWSPDGGWIAFTSQAANGNSGIYIMRADGTDRTRVARVSAMALAWQSLPEGELVSPLPSLSAAPSQSAAPEPTDIGLGFPVCHVSSVEGDFGSGRGTAYIATRMGDTGGCPTEGGGFQVIAVDVSGDGIADGSLGPLECDPACRPFAAPDIDADGIDEIAVAVGTTGGSTLFELYAVAGTTIRPLGYDCTNCNEGVFAWGRPGGHAEGAYCPSGQTPGDFVTWWAEQTDDGNAYSLVEIFIDVKGIFLFEVDRRDSEVPFDASALPPGGGDDFCGAPVAGAAAG